MSPVAGIERHTLQELKLQGTKIRDGVFLPRYSHGINGSEPA